MFLWEVGDLSEVDDRFRQGWRLGPSVLVRPLTELEKKKKRK